MRVLSVVGARPQFIKLAPIDWALRGNGHDHLILHTGQHYDKEMSGNFFEELEISAPTWNLHVGSATHAAQTAQMLIGCEEHFLEAQPDWVVCYGDTNSTVAAALAAVKIQQPIAHVEAGLRSNNRAMPEEHNRVVADHLCDVLLAPTKDAIELLRLEGLVERSVWVGDVMADVVARVGKKSEGRRRDSFVVATIHRAENTDRVDRLRNIVRALAALPIPVRLYAHPRLVDRCEAADVDLRTGSIDVRPPATHRELMSAVAKASGVVTDSGGLQKEAYLLSTPCTTVRSETEWLETMHDGWNVLVEPEGLYEAVMRDRPGKPIDGESFGDGAAAQRIVSVLEERLALAIR